MRGWLGIVLWLCAAGVSGASAQDLAPAPCRFDSSVQAWQGQVDCYRLAVPENRSNPESRTIELAVYALKARSEEPGEPVVYLAGGPGVGGGYYVNLLLRHPVREDRPIIILEQRGIGASGEICPEVRRTYYRRVASHPDNDIRRRRYIGMMRTCMDGFESRGGDINGYTTEENAGDVAALREALGLERMHVWAVSYGTVLAQAYMRLEPDRLGTVVFDAPVPVDTALETDLVANFREVLDRRWHDCVSTGHCDESDDDFATRLERIIPAYNARPLRLLGFSPEPSIVVNFVYVTGVDAAGIIFSLLYADPSPQSIGRTLDLLDRGSSSFLRAHYQRLAVPGFSFGMHHAVDCRGPSVTAETLTELQGADPVLFDAMQVGLQAELCAALSLDPAIADANEPVAYDGPVLVMAGEFDPITPMRLAEPLRGRFPNAGFVEIKGGGHGPSRTLPCAQAMVRAYFADPDAPVPDICAIAEGP